MAMMPGEGAAVIVLRAVMRDRDDLCVSTHAGEVEVAEIVQHARQQISRRHAHDRERTEGAREAEA